MDQTKDFEQEYKRILQLMSDDGDSAEIRREAEMLLTLLKASGSFAGSGLIKLVLLIVIIKLLLNKKFGLKEIKKEIREIEEKLDQIVPVNEILTTGPVVKDVTASSLVVKLLNNTLVVKTVEVRVFNIAVCPKAPFSDQTVVLQPGCSGSFTIGIGPPTLLVQYEVQFEGMQPGVYAWTATRTQAAAPPLMASNFIAANTFRHHELVPQFVPAP